MVGSDRSTLSFALMVVACEALKPVARKFRDRNAYDVIEALLGKAVSDDMRGHLVAPQWVRNEHLHSGVLLGSELVRSALLSSYHDPTFGEAHRTFAQVAPEAIFRWLHFGGQFDMPHRAARHAGKDAPNVSDKRRRN